MAVLEKVYEIGRVFRNEGVDTRHNPEFTSDGIISGIHRLSRNDGSDRELCTVMLQKKYAVELQDSVTKMSRSILESLLRESPW